MRTSPSTRRLSQPTAPFGGRRLVLPDKALPSTRTDPWLTVAHGFDLRDVREVVVIDLIGKILMLEMIDGETVILGDLVGTLGPTGSLAERIRELVG